jgi:hypothetical protein
MSQFSICVPDHKRGLVWCQFPNGNWAPPFPMTGNEKDLPIKEDPKTK